APAEARGLVAAVAASSLGPRLRRISRAALAERERVRAFVGEVDPGRFSGQLSGAALEIAAAQFRYGPGAPASAHQLEEPAPCRFRSLGHRVLRIERDEEDDAELGARGRGSLLHQCLERFFREADLPLRGTPDEIELLREVSEREMTAFAQAS